MAGDLNLNAQRGQNALLKDFWKRKVHHAALDLAFGEYLNRIDCLDMMAECIARRPIMCVVR